MQTRRHERAGAQPAAKSTAAAAVALLLWALVAASSGVVAAARTAPGDAAALARSISLRGSDASGQLPRPALRLLQQCGICPAADAAQATCHAVPQADQDTLLRTAVQYCSRQGFAAAICCPSLPVNDSSKWTQWAACFW